MNESFRGCQIIGNSIQYDFMLLKIQPRNKQRTQRTHTHANGERNDADWVFQMLPTLSNDEKQQLRG